MGKRKREGSGKGVWATGAHLQNELQLALKQCAGWDRGVVSIVASYAEPYCRFDGAKVQVHESEDPKHLKLDGCRVGDVIVQPEEKRYRHVHSLAVTLATHTGLTTEDMCDDSGYGEVPTSVTKYIYDPITFYESLYRDKTNYHRKMPGRDSFSRVMLDGEAHQHILQRLSGGRLVSPKRIVFADFENRGRITVTIVGPKSPDVLDRQLYGSQCALTADTPDEMLGSANWIPTDPLVEGQRQRNRRLHEVLAHDCFITSRPGTSFWVESLPSMKGSSHHMQMDLKSIEVDSETKKVLSVTSEQGETYGPKVVIDRGPFGNVHVWASKNYMIHLHHDPTTDSAILRPS